MKCAGRITVFTGLTGRFFVFQRRLLVGPQSVVLGSVRFFIWTSPSRLDFAAESCGIGRLAKFYGDSDHENDNCYDSIWDAALRHQLHAVRILGTPDRSKQQMQAFVNNKGLLLSDRNIFGQRFHQNSSIQDAISLCLEKLYQSNFTAAKSSYGLLRLFFLCIWCVIIEKKL